MEIIIIVLVAIIVLATFFIKKSKADKNEKRQHQGLDCIKKIKKIITLVQQHRGLNSAWLNGDTKLNSQLATLEQLVSQEINALALSAVSINERWIGFVDHWGRFIHSDKKSSVTNSFEQHTLMIRNLAYLLEDTAENAHLTADFLPELANIGYVWRELIIATESIGQSRAIGAAIAVQKNCSSVDKIKLNFLIQTMKNLTADTLKNLSYLPDESNSHRELVKKATEKINQLIDVVTLELVDSTSITIESSHYFELATDSILKMNDIFDHQVKQVRTVL